MRMPGGRGIDLGGDWIYFSRNFNANAWERGIDVVIDLMYILLGIQMQMRGGGVLILGMIENMWLGIVMQMLRGVLIWMMIESIFLNSSMQMPGRGVWILVLV